MLLPAAARLAVELGHPVYDCVYLALAALHAVPLATADKRLQQVAERIGIRVKT
jgi:predicted nucleic acid-binding protein